MLVRKVIRDHGSHIENVFKSWLLALKLWMNEQSTKNTHERDQVLCKGISILNCVMLHGGELQQHSDAKRHACLLV